MVNEINKPPSSDELNERLAASNRQLQEMHEEHRRLLQEMEALRERATELNRLSQLQQEQNKATPQIEKEKSTESILNEEASLQPTNISENLASCSNETGTCSTSHDAKTNNEDNDTDSAEYIQQKIAEIAALKAQYQRVQHMVNTTKLIENHLSTKNALADVKPNEKKPHQNENSKTTLAHADPPSTSTLTSTLENISSTPPDPKEELLATMLNMFTNFSEDLRGQAESLRAERERIRNLKELLLQRRKGDS